MKKTILNYRVLIEPEQSNQKDYYVAYVPTLGISDFGKTIEEASFNIKQAIQIYLDTLVDLKKPIPAPDSQTYFVTTESVEVRLPANFSFV